MNSAIETNFGLTLLVVRMVWCTMALSEKKTVSTRLVFANSHSTNTSLQQSEDALATAPMKSTTSSDIFPFHSYKSTFNSSSTTTGVFPSINLSLNNEISRRRKRRPPLLTRNQQKLCIGLFSILAIVGVFGNSLVIYIYGFSPRKGFQKFERLMLILGIVDLLASLTNPLLYIYQISHLYSRWNFGMIGCKVIPAIGPITSCISLGVILIMSIDRDRAVVTPFKKQFTTKTIYKAVAFTVFMSITVASPYMYYQKLNKRGSCKLNPNYVKQYAFYGLTVFLLSDIMFLMVLGGTTVRTFLKLSTSSVVTYPKIKEFHDKETNRILRIIITMGITFMVLIFPRDLMQMAYMYTIINPPVVKMPNYLFVHTMLKLLHTSNSSVNVFLYSMVNRRFRRKVLRIFTHCRCVRTMFHYQHSDTSHINNV